ncbi:MAG: hypothetical protein M1135_04300 [Candidatus Omnitrophica bacterium]|jgi:uncharacterized protein YacL|nr:hypothetical protein [Candidatus Omnitrophota bacterium]
MGLYIVRGFFILFLSFAGLFYFPGNKLEGVLIGFLGGLVVIGIEKFFERVPFKKILMGIIGLLIGLLTAILVANFLLLAPFQTTQEIIATRFILYAVFSYLGIIFGIRSVGELGFLLPYFHTIKNQGEDLFVIDSSVAIDGRIYELMKSHFLESTIIIPSFITKELQELADSSSEMKRQRGRRGLETLKKIQEDNSISTKFYEEEYPDIESVDAKLVKLAADIKAKVLTNDFNLAKVAEVQNIKVLNLNTLAVVMKPKLASGEVWNIKVVKEGKEHGQGIGYLEDGTMIVIEEGAKFVGKNIDIIIDTSLQTSTGRIIFAKVK